MDDNIKTALDCIDANRRAAEADVKLLRRTNMAALVVLWITALLLAALGIYHLGYCVP